MAETTTLAKGPTGNETLGIPGHRRNKTAEAKRFLRTLSHTDTASQGRSVKTLEPDEPTAAVGEIESNADKCQSGE